jgi:hypothetical protein
MTEVVGRLGAMRCAADAVWVVRVQAPFPTIPRTRRWEVRTAFDMPIAITVRARIRKNQMHSDTRHSSDTPHQHTGFGAHICADSCTAVHTGRTLNLTATIYIDQSDFHATDDDADYRGLAPGKTVRLLNSYDITCQSVDNDGSLVSSCFSSPQRTCTMAHPTSMDTVRWSCARDFCAAAAGGQQLCTYDAASKTTKPSAKLGKIAWLADDAVEVSYTFWRLTLVVCVQAGTGRNLARLIALQVSVNQYDDLFTGCTVETKDETGKITTKEVSAESAAE